jgi:hypothetical protein
MRRPFHPPPSDRSMLFHLSHVQIFSSAPYSRTVSIYVTFLGLGTKFYTHTEQYRRLSPGLFLLQELKLFHSFFGGRLLHRLHFCLY